MSSQSAFLELSLLDSGEFTNQQWDDRLPTLPMQRQLLHLAIFELLCWNFTPTLLQQPEQVQNLPGYKQVLILRNKKALAVSALNLLEGVSVLHTMMGGSHTRFPGIIVPTFEAAVDAEGATR